MSAANSQECDAIASIVERPTKQPKTASPPKDETRTLKITMLNGDDFEVSVPSNSDVGDLEAAVAKQRQLGPCFTLMGNDSQHLDDISAPLPEEAQFSCFVEDISELPSAAHSILKRVFKRDAEDPKKLHDLRLGRCRKFGKFPGSQWKEGGIESAISDLEEEDDDDSIYDMYGEYNVMEFTLVNGDNKRLRFIAIINEGDADANTGMWGSVYRRPCMQLVATIRSDGDTESQWCIEDDVVYKAPSESLIVCDSQLFGGGDKATTPFMVHLAHALAAADSCEASIEE